MDILSLSVKTKPRVSKKRCTVPHSASACTGQAVLTGDCMPRQRPASPATVPFECNLHHNLASRKSSQAQAPGSLGVAASRAGKCLRAPAASTWRPSWKLGSGLGGRGVLITGGGQVQLQILLLRRSQLGAW